MSRTPPTAVLALICASGAGAQLPEASPPQDALPSLDSLDVEPLTDTLNAREGPGSRVTLLVELGQAPEPAWEARPPAPGGDLQEQPSQASQDIAGAMGGVLGIFPGALAGILLLSPLCEGEYCALAGAKPGAVVGAVVGFLWARKAHRENPPTPPRRE